MKNTKTNQPKIPRLFGKLRATPFKKGDSRCGFPLFKGGAERLARWGIFVLSFYFLLSTFYFIAYAQSSETADSLQQKIDSRNSDISALEDQIKSYQKQITDLGTQATSLAGTIKTLDLTQKKLAVDIAVTQNKIEEKNLEIQQLAKQISGKESNISDDRRIIRQSLTTVWQSSDQSIEEIIIGSHSISDLSDSLDTLSSLQKGLYDRITGLNKDKSNLETSKHKSEKAQAELVALTKQLGDQRKVVLSTAAQQKALLDQTHSSESAYKKILADKKAQEAAFQQEVNNYEAQLHLLVNPSLLPHTGSGVLSYPLDKIVITQYFGNTPFATANPQIYNGKGHTGVDFGTPIGTPVKAALSGIVVGAGNTDGYPGCQSFGKWIMLRHPDGLSTLYAHLSLPTVSVGQSVATGEVIAYSGNTGYSTGPHLHFGVYATQGVVIKAFEAGSHCQGAVIPFADPKAYLNPLSYL